MKLEGLQVAVIGASGWLGRHLVKRLNETGAQVVAYSRRERDDEGAEWRVWDGESVPDFEGVKAVVNLAGESIAQRWTTTKKIQLRTSRIEVTQRVVEGMKKTGVETLVNASAVGIYGDRGDEVLPESASSGVGYLAKLCEDWEEAAQSPARTVLLRTGIVLGQGGGAWAQLGRVFRLGLGGRLGSGSQWVPWIHLDDEIAAIVHCLEKDTVSGPVNLTAPQPVTNRDFTKLVAREVRRPAIFHVPAFMLKLLLGEFGTEGLLASQRTEAVVLQETGFHFRYPDLASALSHL